MKQYDRVEIAVATDGYPAGTVGVLVDLHPTWGWVELGGGDSDLFDVIDVPLADLKPAPAAAIHAA